MPPCAAKRPHGPPRKAPAPGRDRARPLPSYRKYCKNNPPSHPGKKSKGRARRPFLCVVLRRVWEGNRNPSQNLSWGARGDILLIRKEYPLASLRSSSELSSPPIGRALHGPSPGPKAAILIAPPGCPTAQRQDAQKRAAFRRPLGGCFLSGRAWRWRSPDRCARWPRQTWGPR